MLPKSILSKMKTGLSVSALALSVSSVSWAENAEPAKTPEVCKLPPELSAEQKDSLNKQIPLLQSKNPTERQIAEQVIQGLGKAALIPLQTQMLTTKDGELAGKLRKLIRAMGGDDCPTCGRG